MRHQFSIRIGAAAANLGKLFVGQPGIVSVRKIIEQRARRSILLLGRKSFDLLERLFKKFGHALFLSENYRKCTPDPGRIDTLVVGDGANDLAMIQRAGLGVAYHAKPAVAAAASARIDFGDLTALLYAQGYRRDEFVTG
jgi:phosphoserine phosphatase